MGSVFKSITTYDLNLLHSSEITITGKGIITINNMENNENRILIDDRVVYIYSSAVLNNFGSCFLFGLSLKLFKTTCPVSVTVGLFN